MAHYGLRGDLIEHGVPLGPGAFSTHPAGAVHGPHESRGDFAMPTLQATYVNPAASELHVAE